MIKLYNFDELKPEEILNRDIRAEKNVEDVVDAIIADVRTRGDEALKEYALKFDGATVDALQVTQAEIDEAFAGMDPYFLETLREAAANIESFHRRQVHKNFVVNDKPGIVLGQKYTPIEKAGVYLRWNSFESGGFSSERYDDCGRYSADCRCAVCEHHQG